MGNKYRGNWLLCMILEGASVNLGTFMFGFAAASIHIAYNVGIPAAGYLSKHRQLIPRTLPLIIKSIRPGYSLASSGAANSRCNTTTHLT